MKQSETIAKLSAALVSAHRSIQPIAKDSVNPHFKSKFASLDAIMTDVRPILAENGLAIIQGATTPHTTENGIVTAFTVETQLVHASGEWVLSSVVMPIIKADPQGAGAAITYGRRYGISALLGLSTDDDDDGNSASQRSEGNGRAASAARSSGPTTGNRETPPKATAPSLPPSVMPFGKSKGKPTTSLAVDDLQGALDWARANKPVPYAAWIADAEKVLADKILDLDREGAGV